MAGNSFKLFINIRKSDRITTTFSQSTKQTIFIIEFRLWLQSFEPLFLQ